MGNIILKLDNLIRKNPIVFVVILFFVVVLITSTMYITYAYFTANIQGQGNQITISTSSGSLTFTDQNELNETGITPGTTITKTFFVTNTSNGALTYKLNWKFLKNNFYNRDNLKYSITSTGGGSLSTAKIPDSEDHINILTNTIPGNTTQTYTMTIIYEDAGQGNIDKDKNIVGKLEITNIEVDTIAPQTSNGTYNTSLAGKTTIYGITLGSLAREIYPVGSIYTSTESTDPSELFIGTTWEVYGTGRTLVGVGTGTDASGKQKSFSVNSTGGTPDEILAYHNHGLNGDGARTLPSGAHTHEVSGNTTTGGLHTHTVPAGSISTTVTNNEEYRTRMTAMPDELAEDEDEKFEEGVYYGEHTHNFSGTGQTSATTTGASSAHSHTYQIPSLTTKAGGGKHTHTTKSVGGNGTTLADAILNENTPSPDPVTTPGRQVATTDEGLIIGPTDDYGNDTFYFRGAVNDNYVSFAGFTWRVVRINGDGTIRMILDGTTESQIAWSNAIINNSTDALNAIKYENSLVKTHIENWYNTNIGNNNTYDNMVATGKFCYDLTDDGYNSLWEFRASCRAGSGSSYGYSENPRFTCPNASDIHNLKVGTINYDEAAFAGGKYLNTNNNYYLYSNNDYWLFSPDYWDSGEDYVYIGSVKNDGKLDGQYGNLSKYVRPVINLKSNVEISGGTGTSSNPYEVSDVSYSTSTETGHTHTLAAGALKSTNTGNSGASGNGSSHTHSMQSIFSSGSGGSSDAYVMQNNRANASLTSGAEGAHTHTIAAGNLKVYSKAAVTLPASTTKHTHSMTIPALNINSSGSHTHTTPAVSGLTTGSNAVALTDKIKEDNPPVANPTTTPGRQISTTDEGLIAGPNDDYGNTTYYFRGNVQDNYVSFAGKTWKVIRINGDGSVRMILNGSAETNAAWNTNKDSTSGLAMRTSDYNTMLSWISYDNSPVKTTLESWYDENIGINTYDSMVATGKFCNDKSHTGTTTPINLGPYNRLSSLSSASPQFTCPSSSDIYNIKVGLITADEVAYAGGTQISTNNDYYLNIPTRIMSPYDWNTANNVNVYFLFGSGYFTADSVSMSRPMSPVINLKSNVYVNGGDGTENNPYTLSSSPSSQEGAHSHNIPSLNITDVTGSTIDNNSAGTHVHTVNIPSIRSRNNSAIAVSSTGSGHSHDIEGTTNSTGAHTHTLVGNTSVVGTSGTNANLQPYITVYMWRRTA